MLNLKIVLGSPFTGINNGWVHRYIHLIKGLIHYFPISLFIPGSGQKLRDELSQVTIFDYPQAMPIGKKCTFLRLICSYVFPQRTQIFLPTFKYYPGYESYIKEKHTGSDISIYFGLNTLIYYGQNDTSPLVFCDFCDSISRNMHNQIKQKKRNSFIGFTDLLYLKRIKRSFVPKDIKVIGITDMDCDYIREMLPRNSTITVPNGIQIPAHKNDLKSKFESNYLIFVGALNYIPNVDSISFIIKKIWPEISRQFENLKLLIVGRNPASEVISLSKSDSRISVQANVADVFPFIQKSKLLLCPMFLGGGLKNKILEALINSTPVLTNTEGSIGIPIINKVHGCIAESRDEMVRGISEILKMNYESYLLMANSCYELARKFTWDAVTNRFKEIIITNYTEKKQG